MPDKHTFLTNEEALNEGIKWLKSLQFSVEYAKEQDGSFTGFVKEFNTAENAPTLEELNKELIKGMREWASLYAEDLPAWTIGRVAEIPYIFKIFYSTDEELASCLHGKSYDGF